MSERTAATGRTGFLAEERATLARLVPDVAEMLDDHPLMELEGPESGAIKAFRASDAPALVAPLDHAGLGATPLELLRVQRAIGSRSPSLAVASTMHHFSLATLVEFCERSGGVEWMVVEGLVGERMLLASGFAEGKTGQSVLEPTMVARRRGDGYVISGSKKPCSLTYSMDLLTASVAIAEGDEDDPSQRGVAMVPAASPGIERRPFWGSGVLRAAESDELILNEVELPAALVFSQTADDPTGEHELRGFLWFELLIAGSYLGVASALVERLLQAGKGGPELRSELAGELEFAMAALERFAIAMGEGRRGAPFLAQALFARYGAQRAASRSAVAAARALGGMEFIRTEDVSYLLAAAQALAFHPPSERSAAPELVRHLEGNGFELA